VQPQVQFENDLESTVTAVAGVASGRAEIGLLGREIWPKESAEFAKTRGHAPLVIDIATGSYDVPKATFALMVFVPAANPIASVSLAQLKSTFAAGDGTIHTWGELGLDGEWAARPIHLYGFAVDNDKSQIFRQLVFGGSQSWSPRLKEFSNAGGRDAGQLIVNAVANDPGAIGISNVHYATDSVRALAVSGHADPRPIPPTRENVKTRKYPLTRAVYMVVDADASDAMNPAAGVSALCAEPAGRGRSVAGGKLSAAAGNNCAAGTGFAFDGGEVSAKKARPPEFGERQLYF
jgi:phosphate transport system substrate-binding protein